MIGSGAPSVSRLRLLFGQYPQQLRAKITGLFSVDPQKANQTRMGYSQFLAENLPQRGVVAQLVPRNGNAQQLAAAIQQLVDQMASQSSYKIKACARPDNKVYLTIQSEEILMMIQQFDQSITPADLMGSNGNELEMQIASETDIEAMTARGLNIWDYYRSLLVDIKLTKSKALEKLLGVLTDMMVPPNLVAPITKAVERFSTLNLDLRFASTDIAPPELRGQAGELVGGINGDPTEDKIRQLCSLIAPDSQVTLYGNNLLAQLHVTGFNVLGHLLWLDTQS